MNDPVFDRFLLIYDSNTGCDSNGKEIHCFVMAVTERRSMVWYGAQHLLKQYALEVPSYPFSHSSLP